MFFTNPNKKSVRESIDRSLGQDILSCDVWEQRSGRLRKCNNDDLGQLLAENSARTQKQLAKQLGVTQRDHFKSPTRDGNDSERRKVGVLWNCCTISSNHTLLLIKRYRTESWTRNYVTYGMFTWRFFVTTCFCRCSTVCRICTFVRPMKSGRNGWTTWSWQKTRHSFEVEFIGCLIDGSIESAYFMEDDSYYFEQNIRLIFF